MIGAVTMAGGLMLPRLSGEEADELRARHRLVNPAWRGWDRRRERLVRDAAKEPVGSAAREKLTKDLAKHMAREPNGWITALRRVPAGPWKGAHWLPRALQVEAASFSDRTSRPVLLPADLAPGLEPRPYQVEALDGLLRYMQGLAVIPCGGGKTTLGIMACAAINTPTVILVNSRALAHQWITALRARLVDADVGLVGDGSDERDARIVVALVQTLAEWDWWELCSWGRGRGLAVYDEVHHAAAEQLLDILGALAARYRLGLTATERADGLMPLVDWSFGRRLVELRPSDLEAGGWTLAPSITWVRTGWEVPLHPTEAAAAVTRNNGRNHLIVEEVGRRAREGRRGLVLVDRLEHVLVLHRLLEAAGVPSATLIGSTSHTQRDSRLARLARGDLRTIVATSVADEGLDVPELDHVVLAVPGRNRTRLQQRVGRCVRVHPGKPDPEVVDLVDSGFVGRSQALAREEIYAACGWSAGSPPVDQRLGGWRDQEPPIDDEWEEQCA